MTNTTFRFILVMASIAVAGRGANAQPTQVMNGVPVTTCRAVVPAAVHVAMTPACDPLNQPFSGNRRLALIDNGTVPCVEVDTLEVTRCLFNAVGRGAREIRAMGPASGHWLEDREGLRYAVVGQPVTRDGSLAGGNFVVGTLLDVDGRVPCVSSTGRDAAASGGETDAAAAGAMETLGSETNASGQPLMNHTDRYVGTSTLVHPDDAELVSVDPERLVAWYTGRGAAVNDAQGRERDHNGGYYGDSLLPHFVMVGSVMVPAAKRPATRSYPAPGAVDVTTRIQWRPYNPYVTISNGSCVDPRGRSPFTASFTVEVGLTTVWLDASASEGDIVRFVWDLDWTDNPKDAVTTTPTAEIPLLITGPRNSGSISLTVVTRDGQATTVRRHVTFKTRTRPLIPGGPGPVR